MKRLLYNGLLLLARLNIWRLLMHGFSSSWWWVVFYTLYILLVYRLGIVHNSNHKIHKTTLHCLVLHLDEFAFIIKVKSMAQYLDSIDKFFYPRNARFPQQFMDDVKALVGMATSEIIEQFSQVYMYVFAFVPSTYCMIQTCFAFVCRFASPSCIYFIKKYYTYFILYH